MEFAIDFDAGTPIYLQLKDQIRYAISVGELQPGSSLPSIRTLEAELGLNRNTARRAYVELQQEGTLLMRRGKEAQVAPKAARGRRRQAGADAEELARKVVRDVESKGLDGLRFAAVLTQVAQDHNVRYPKCAFVECSRTQAEDLAGATQAAWQRYVIPVDLNRLRKEPGLLPPSVRYVITTHWHLAEVTRLVRQQHVTIREVRLRPAESFLAGVDRLAGLKTGLILRDPESIAGYRGLLQKHVKKKGAVHVALMGEKKQALALIRSAQGLVFTAPCREFVTEHAPPEAVTLELLCEPLPEDLSLLEEELFT